MKWASRCPICGGKLVGETVEKLLRGGSNVASIKVRAAVCHRCGEVVYNAATVRKFQEIRVKLERNEVADFSLLGKAYVVN